MNPSTLRSNELVRKAIHLSSSIIPLMYWFLFDRSIVLRVVIFLSLGFLIAEFLRMHSQSGKKIFLLIFGPALRSHEKTTLTGATYVFTGAVLCIFLFPKEIAVPSLLILSISDTFAALIGIPFGRHKFLAKSMEGSLAFFLVTSIILTLFFPQRLFLNLVVAAIMTTAEAYPMDLDDNFMIPILSGVLLTLVSFL